MITVGGSGTNYILNGDFEDEGLYWNLTSMEATGAAIGTGKGHYTLRTVPGASGICKAKQYVTLSGGEYTLSFIYNSTNMSGSTITVTAKNMDSNAVIASKAFPIDNKTVTDLISASVPLNINTDEADVEISISVNLPSSSFSTEFFIDNVMLERGNSVNSFNMVNMGHFEKSSINSAQNLFKIPSNFWKTDANGPITTTAEKSISGDALRITASENVLWSDYAVQRI